MSDISIEENSDQKRIEKHLKKAFETRATRKRPKNVKRKISSYKKSKMQDHVIKHEHYLVQVQ